MSNKLHNWLKTFHKAGDPARSVPSVDDANRIANVIQDITGVGCRIEKPIDAGGLNWRIIIDGTSDEPLPNGYTVPWVAPADLAPGGAMFDISGVTTDSFSITDAGVTTGGMGYTSERLTSLTAGTGMGGPAGGYYTPSPVVSADCFIYLEVRGNAGCNIVKGTALPDIDAQDYDIIPLWFIPWAAAAIDEDNIIDMRNSDFRLPVRHTESAYMGLFLDSNLEMKWDWPRFHA